jgi:exodeoxyribonuclease-3
MKLLSWNVNGIRARHSNGHLEQVFNEKPDILCLQEVKASPEQLPSQLKNMDGYHYYLNHSTTSSFKGVGIFTLKKSFNVQNGFINTEEGRVLKAEFDEFKLYNIYFPDGAGPPGKLKIKFNFYNKFLKALEQESDENIIVCGDFNIAHQERDLVDPKRASRSAGFLPEERALLDKLIGLGFTDSYRLFNQESDKFTWWSYGHNSRENNIGMRLDYFFVSNSLKNNIKDAKIRNDISGSDHCPIELNLSL